jgi:hypothetical protein
MPGQVVLVLTESTSALVIHGVLGHVRRQVGLGKQGGQLLEGGVVVVVALGGAGGEH